MTDRATAVETRSLTRSYGTGRRGGSEVYALRGVDLSVGQGEVHGLLGPNGAGKTTLCRILSTILLPTSGTARIMGRDVVRDADAVKRCIGIVFGGDRGLYGRLTVGDNLRFWAALYGLRGTGLRRRCQALLERMGLAHRADDRVDTLSRGMKQRLHLARGLVADPPLLILDEPTVGMDPVAAQDFRVLVDGLRADGRTILLTTHDMAEAEAVCDRVSLVDHGRIIATRAPAGIGALISRYERIEARGVPAEVAAALPDIPGVVTVRAAAGERLRIETEDTSATRAVLRRLVAEDVTEVATSRPTLEEVYLHLIGERGMTVER
ncbi:ABC transporter ATP-binding protein [Streptomyces sp. MP131-18]|uniref:ABC transporter ATP-binding protein n=1 Tax=Streptomyces sp. MP131-18 TaxID=1857892 RepID=UPI00097BDFA9|nr:ABC transporter ATP-binding protein [Streptomyces sp. MP131-18]ONK16050.1 putative ABC transporter ATP-binding protein YbhF [Streptomyces sp. MP131-18]